MSQPPQSHRPASPLTARLYDLEYPRSLGVYSTYQEVQSVVDTLADREFPVQSTLIVGTDLKLMERVTGRRTWPKVIGQGVLSGLWMGLFLGLLFMLITPGDLMIVISSVLMGIVFFTVWSVIGYAMTGGKRDFTSMTATIPMQYELLVEHKHAQQARQILAETGAAPTHAPTPATGPVPVSPQAAGRFGTSAPSPSAGYGAPSAAQGAAAQGAAAQQAAPGSQTTSGRYGAPAAEEGTAPEARPHRPSFGRPASTPPQDSPADGAAPGEGRPPAAGARQDDAPER
ncbi:MAG TPA: hypothetical protein H9932_02195 [Candidatus Brachybacterium intestinipullorum]|uniref:General stress protein 17M-like domain-containing protein n=1 Tax=Candidatus Brachybacterium intestinipullorum TaxID=2838512 RepID=A0A9D2Q061_9MICO|nr:hypothetical protein [Candidatus Brachybacterium intestinipullorum]